jgi:hypothetical protein
MKLALGGQNRTGGGRAPELVEAMVDATTEFPPSSPGDETAIAKVRLEYARKAEPVGTMPPPGSVRGVAKTALSAMKGGHPIVLMDKLGERLAFERAGTRLYDALISKYDAGRTFKGGPSREDLVHIRDEEEAHFLLVGEAIEKLGGDPTAVTPSANVQATASKGLPGVLADPRTDLLQCLEAMLVAELVDNDCWPALIELAESAGETHLVEQFGEALEHEREHLENVRSWVAAGTGRSLERALEAGTETQREPFASARQQSGKSAQTASPRRTRASAKRGRSSRRAAGRKTGRAAKGKGKGRRPG